MNVSHEHEWAFVCAGECATSARPVDQGAVRIRQPARTARPVRTDSEPADDRDATPKNYHLELRMLAQTANIAQKCGTPRPRRAA